jgi:hypothetical protein
MTTQVSEDTRAVAKHNDYLNRESSGGPNWIMPLKGPGDEAQIKKEIAKRYADKARKNAKSRNPWTIKNNVRVSEFGKIFHHRYRVVLPDDDAGLSDLIPAIRHILATESEENARRFAASWAPWCIDSRFDELVEEIGPNPTPQKAWELGKELLLTYQLRKYLKIHTIGPCDVTKRQFTELKKREDAERKRFKRLADGGMPREIYESLSKTRTEPWKPMGWSKRTYHRRVKKLGQAAVDAMVEDARIKSGTTPSGVNLHTLRRTHLCQLTDGSQRLHGTGPNHDVLPGSSGRDRNLQAGEAANDNSRPADVEAPTAVAA